MKTEIYNELKEIAPILSDVDNTGGFKVPSGYFERMNKGITNALDITESDKMPSGYFENLPEKVLAQAKNKKERTAIDKSPNIISLRRLSAIAAVFILGIFGVMSLMTQEEVISTDYFLAEVSDEEQLDYLLYEDEHIYSDMYDYLEEEDIEALFDIENTIEDDDELFDILDNEDIYSLEELM